MKCVLLSTMGKENMPSLISSKYSLHPKVMLCTWSWWWGGKALCITTSFHKIGHVLLSELNKGCNQWKVSGISQQKGVRTTLDIKSLCKPDKSVQVGWYIQLHSPYSTDLATSDYLVCRSLQISLEASENHLNSFITQKDVKFWGDGIVELPQRWWKVV